MNNKSAHILELPKILERLSRYCAFSASIDLALNLEPTSYLDEAIDRQKETSEARALLNSHDNVTVGGARDIRGAALSAARGIALDPQAILDIRNTLRQSSQLKRILGRLHNQYPTLASITDRLEECTPLQNEISRILDDTGQVMDSASPKLGTLRREMRIAFDRLQTKLNNLLHNQNTAQYLQETLITQRHGRYVVPLRAEFKGRIQGIVHDQSSSGATLFIEPLATVELNNTWRELQLEEENEVRRILRELCDLIGKESKFIIRTVETLALLDLAFAKAKYAEALLATEPELLGFQDVPHPHPGSVMYLLAARHPLLDQKKVVPIDVTLDPETYALVITGPNTGGKTVALKTIGLMILMAQCGLHIPANQGSRLTVFRDVFADIGDEQSIEQSLSTFSAHMTNIIDILEDADSQSLVILDELGAGTDPAEGSALARSLMDDLVDAGVTTLVTTHHPELKIYSHEKLGVRNASMEFNLETLAPTYRLIVGLPGRSNALAIASRLGLPDRIIERARGLVTDDDLLADDLLSEIHKTRDEIRDAHTMANRAQSEVEELRDELRLRLDDIETERRRLLADMRAEAGQEIEALKSELRRMKRQLMVAGQPLDVIRQVESELNDLDAELLSVPVPATTIPGDDGNHRFRMGDLVWVTTLGAEGQITELSASDAEVMVGRLRLRAKLDELTPRSRGESKRQKKKSIRRSDDSSATVSRPASPGLELDLRGQTVEDALPRMEEYLDAAYMAGLPFVRIIHGKGTGALRIAIRDELRGHPLVKNYARGGEKEGGDGVTVVNMVPAN